MSEDLTKQLPSDNQGILARLDSIDTRLETLEDKVDRRLQETRPIWERVLTELSEVRTEVSQVHTEINEVRTEMREGFAKVYVEMDKGMRRVAREVDVLNRNVLEVRADLRYLDQRITKLEGEPAP